MKYFWDTYALVLLLEGDPRILPYAQEKGITSTLNVAELCAYLLRAGIDCRDIVNRLREAFVIVDIIPLEIALSAAELRHRMRSRGKRWSYVDSIGYLLAKKVGAKFLTGDREFRNEEGVEFIGGRNPKR